MKKEFECPEAYSKLADILIEAFNFTAYGKGEERHGGGRAFEDQPILDIPRMLESPDGPLFQAMKKCQEASRFFKKNKTKEAVYELKGAIAYIAGAILYMRENNKESATSWVYYDKDKANLVYKYPLYIHYSWEDRGSANEKGSGALTNKYPPIMPSDLYDAAMEKLSTADKASTEYINDYEIEQYMIEEEFAEWNAKHKDKSSADSMLDGTDGDN